IHSKNVMNRGVIRRMDIIDIKKISRLNLKLQQNPALRLPYHLKIQIAFFCRKDRNIQQLDQQEQDIYNS
ncbi:MAG: hypothetical protein KAT81_07460, partial [Syntrophobacterales bacterium]|nr:hypothetical protein [Syntrophobacterales bacterium]